MTDYRLVPVEKLKEWEAAINTIALQTAFDIADDIAQYSYAPDVQGEPECGCCGQTVKCDDDCDAVVIGGNKPTPDELSDYDRGFRDGKLDQLIDEVVAESALMEALEQIRAIEDELYGGDWDEIEKARNIANEALAAYRKGSKS